MSKYKQIRIAVMVANNVEDIELIVPLDIWKRAGFVVDVIVCENRNSFSLANSGLKLNSPSNLKAVNLIQYDAIFLPGGPAHKSFLTPPITIKDHSESKLHIAIKRFFDDKDKWLIALCASPIVFKIVLEHNEKMKKTLYTAYNDPNLLRGLEECWLNERIVIDKNLITGQAAGCAAELAFTVIEKLSSPELAQEVADRILYPWEEVRKQHLKYLK